MNELTETINIENMIYEIDGKEVMLDSDLAKLNNVETKRINEAVYRNKEKFPERFCWQLSVTATEKLSRSQNATLNIERGANIKYGASLKDVGKKCFSIHEFTDRKYTINVLENIGLRNNN